jgi:hypothetical protein
VPRETDRSKALAVFNLERSLIRIRIPSLRSSSGGAAGGKQIQEEGEDWRANLSTLYVMRLTGMNRDMNAVDLPAKLGTIMLDSATSE